MRLKEIQFDARLKFFGAVLVLLSLAFSASAGPQSSAHYLVTNGSVDGGGLRVSSAHYASDGSFSSGSLIASADYTQRGGYVAALNNAPVAVTNYTISLFTNGIFKVAAGAVAPDPDGDQTAFVSLQNPTAQNGSVSNGVVWAYYRPALDYAGNDSFNFTVRDSEGDSASGTVLAQITGTPVTPDSPTLNLIGLNFHSTAATLKFSGLPGTTYTVQFTDSLIQPVIWATLGSATVTNGVITIVDPTAGLVPQRFYRTLFQSSR